MLSAEKLTGYLGDWCKTCKKMNISTVLLVKVTKCINIVHHPGDMFFSLTSLMSLVYDRTPLVSEKSWF